MGDSVADLVDVTARSAKRESRKKRGRRPTETDKLQRLAGWLDFAKKRRPGLLRETVEDDDDVNVGASLTYRKLW